MPTAPANLDHPRFPVKTPEVAEDKFWIFRLEDPTGLCLIRNVKGANDLDLRECLNRKDFRAWCLYDVGNSAFATTVMAVLFPLFFREHLAANLTGTATATVWSLGSALSLLLSALLCPLAGTWADSRGNHRESLMAMVLSGAFLTALIGSLPQGEWLLGLACFVGATLTFSLGNVFYDAFLPVLAPEKERAILSSAGFAMGYLGGGTLLLANILMIMLLPSPWGNISAFWSVSLWWFSFSFPLYRNAPPMRPSAPGHRGLKDVASRLRIIVRTPQVLQFLLAYWLYNDGIGTIMKMGVLYGSLLGIGRGHLLGALLATQFIGIPSTLLFGRLGRRWGDKTALLLGLSGYLFLVAWAFFLSANWHFWILALGVGTVQGGTQALSRSLFSQLIPPGKGGEFFGFYQLSGRLAGLGGPLIFGGAAHLTGSVRSGVPFLALFFLAGMGILLRLKIPSPIGENRS